MRLEGRVAIVTGAGSVGPGWGNGRAAVVRAIIARVLVCNPAAFFGFEKGL